MIDDIVDFTTAKERLEDAKASMVVAYYDYEDNAGSSMAERLWQDFEHKRDQYLKLRERVEGKDWRCNETDVRKTERS